MTDQGSPDQHQHAAEDFVHVASLIRKYTNDSASLRAVMANNTNIILAALEYAEAYAAALNKGTEDRADV